MEEPEAAEAASLAEREEFVGEEELAGPEDESGEPDEGELVGPEPSDSLPQVEPPSPPRRRLRKAGDVAGRQTSQQPPCRATRSTAASTVAAGAPHAAAATGAGSSRAGPQSPPSCQGIPPLHLIAPEVGRTSTSPRSAPTRRKKKIVVWARRRSSEYLPYRESNDRKAKLPKFEQSLFKFLSYLPRTTLLCMVLPYAF